MVYSRQRLKAIDKSLLDKYFLQLDGDKFKLQDSVRSVVRFISHDVIKDKPILHCDIILCRNLLIYFNKELQEEILLKFYEALNTGGFLVLGMVESLVGSTINAFEHLNNPLCIYRKPENKTLGYEKGHILTQADIDKIVSEMLAK